MGESTAGGNRAAWREKLRVIIFEADTDAGKAFDVALLIAIVLSITAVMAESVAWYRVRYRPALDVIEWGFTIIFTIEYILRLVSVPRATTYARSFFGIVDLLAILPTYLSVLFPGSESLLVIRALRLLRIFRVFKLGRFLGEADILTSALRRSRQRITVFLGTVLILVTILGAVMYLIEGEENGFTSIPRAVYWAVITMTTVGYGDIVPRTMMGQTLAAFVMVIGYSILAVPTGIVTAEIVEAATSKASAITTRACPHCLTEGHLPQARFCKDCGSELEHYESEEM